MLGLGWTEMLVIGLAALIFIGPKDLPVVMNRVGKIIGQVRRMGSEFQREINKTTGMDEVRNLRNSITGPLKQTSDEIRREFNTMTPTGQKPSGIIKPADPKAESVVDEIRAAAGMSPAPAKVTAAPDLEPTPVKPATRKPAARKAPVRAKAAPTRPVITTDLPPVSAETVVDAPVAPAPKKAAAKKAPTAKAASPAKKPAVRKPAVAKPAADVAADTAPKPVAAPKKRAAPKTTAKAGNE